MDEHYITHADHYEALREWARGMLHLEAGTELLIRIGFAKPWYPWVEEGPWVDHTLITNNLDGLAGADQRLLRIVEMLLDPARDSLGGLLASMEQEDLKRVLAAVSQAAGSRTGAAAEIIDGEIRTVWVEAAYPWPDEF